MDNWKGDTETHRKKLVEDPGMIDENSKIIKDYWERRGKELIKYGSAPRGIQRIIDSGNFHDDVRGYLDI